MISIIHFWEQLFVGENLFYGKGVRALRGYFGPSLEPKTESWFSPISSYWFVRRKAQVKNSGIYLILPVAMVTKMADKTGLK